MSNIKLSRLLKETHINLDLKQTSKKKVLVELLEFVAKCGRLKDKRALCNAILKRERLGSTGIGGGVAIPHAKLNKLRDFILVFARHNAGVDFGALDGEKTHLFFLLASPHQEVGSHLKILSDIARLVKDKFIVDRLKTLKNKKEIIRLIKTYEE